MSPRTRKKPAKSEKAPPPVRDLIRKRLKEVKRTPAELADNVDLPVSYIEDLIAGRRRPPLPSRTDIYDKMTPFLKLSRNELADCATAERAASAPTKIPTPKPKILRVLMDLCEPETAKKLERRRSRNGKEELAGYLQRLLDVTQTAVRRMLTEQVSLRVAARGSGATYADMRLEILEFLDTTPDTLTMEDVAKFLLPRVQLWDVDLNDGALRVVLQ